MTDSGTPATHGNVHELVVALGLDEAASRRAFELASLVPGRDTWRHYLDRFLLAVGVTLMLAGIAAFIAWNWADLHRFVKFALVEAAIVVAAALAWHYRLDSAAGRVSLLAAGFLVGVLLALYGQVYQTGADPYGLFLGWLLLILPWAIIGRQAGLWLLAVVLANLALILYWIQVLYPPDGWWTLARLMGPLVWLGGTVTDWRLASLLFGFNALAVVAWELAAARGLTWAQDRLFPRLIALIALYTVVAPTLLQIFAAAADTRLRLSVLSPALCAAAIAACLWYYRYRRHDLLMLTLALVAGILVVTAFAIRHLADALDNLLLIAVLLIGQVGGAAVWLKGVAREHEAMP